MSFLSHAKRLADLGFYVFPLQPNGKLPAVDSFTEAATQKPNQIEVFWGPKVLDFAQPFNIGIATTDFYFNPAEGDLGLLVVDVDVKGKKKGLETLNSLELNGCQFPETFTQKTPTGGMHLVYKVQKAVKQGVEVLGPGLDIRSQGGYIVGSGSEIDGKKYTDNGKPLAWAPYWLVSKCCSIKELPKKSENKIAPVEINEEMAKERAAEYLEKTAPVSIQGQGGNENAFKVASKIKDLGVSQAMALDLMLESWNDRCEPPWDSEELKNIVANAYRYGQNAVGSDSAQADFDEVPIDTEKVESGIHPVEKLNQDFSFIILGGKSTVIRHGNKDREDDFISTQAFHDLLKAKRIDVGGKFVELTKYWLSHPDRKTYYDMGLFPVNCPPDTYNLWRGFSCEPLKKDESPSAEMIEGVRLFEEHALLNVCANDPKLFDWLMGYFAHLVQKPFEKPLTALVFQGQKGVGKNALIDRVGNLFKSHYLVTSNKRYLTSNFNKHMASLLLFVLDEAFWSGDKQAEGTLKDLITGNSHLIEHKGREMFSAKNLTRVVIIGNEDWLVPATHDERRFAIFKVGANRQKDGPYFSKMRRLIDHEGGNRFLLRKLLDFDLSKTDLNTAPETKGLLDQKIESLSPVQAWWLDCLREGKIVNLSEFKEDWPIEVGCSQMRDAFFIHAKSRGTRWLPSAEAFGRQFKKCVFSLQIARPMIAGERVRKYILPPLFEAKKQFELFMGHSIDWDDEETQSQFDPKTIFS